MPDFFIMKQNWKSALMLVVLALVWGSSFMLMKRALIAFNPIQLASFRLSLASLTLLPLVIPKLKTVSKKDWQFIAIVGFFGNGIPAFLFAIAQTHINSATAGALNALTPLFTLVVGIVLFQKKHTLLRKIGVVIGLLGSLFLIFVRSNGTYEVNFGYALLIVIATLFYGVSTNVIKSKLQHVNSIVVAGGGLMLASFPAMFILYNSGFVDVLNTNPKANEALMYLSTLAVLGSAFALVLFNYLSSFTRLLM